MNTGEPELGIFGPASLRKETEDNLLYTISVWEEDEPTAKAAMNEILFRHKDYLYARCEYLIRKNKNICPDIDADEIFLAAMDKLRDKAGTYNPPPDSRTTDPKWQFRLWMHSILNNLLFDIRRRRIISHTQDPAFWDDRADVEDNQGIFSMTCAEGEILMGCFDQLPEKQRIILTNSGAYSPQGKGRHALSTAELQELCDSLGTTSEGFRQIRVRARQAMIKCLESKKFDVNKWNKEEVI